MGKLAGVVAFALLAAAPVGACSGKIAPPCHAGDYVACGCDAQVQGYARCFGQDYGPCDCSGTTPGLDADLPEASDAALDAGPCKVGCAFGSPCEGPDGCEAGLTCFAFATQGLRCTKACQADADCPVISGKCGGQKACKVQ